MRVLIDTNVLVSRLLVKSSANSAISHIIAEAVAGTYTLLLSEDVLDELYALRARKAYLRERVTERDIDDLVWVLRSIAEIVRRQTDPVPSVLRDPRDDFLLVAAVMGNAEYLVTGDRDLLDIRDQLTMLQIVTVTEFSEMLSSGQS